MFLKEKVGEGYNSIARTFSLSKIKAINNFRATKVSLLLNFARYRVTNKGWEFNDDLNLNYKDLGFAGYPWK